MLLNVKNNTLINNSNNNNIRFPIENIVNILPNLISS